MLSGSFWGAVRAWLAPGHRSRLCSSSVASLGELAQQIPWHQECGQAGTALSAQNLPEIPSWGAMNSLSFISHKESHKILFFFLLYLTLSWLCWSHSPKTQQPQINELTATSPGAQAVPRVWDELGGLCTPVSGRKLG